MVVMSEFFKQIINRVIEGKGSMQSMQKQNKTIQNTKCNQPISYGIISRWTEGQTNQWADPKTQQLTE